MRAKTKCPVTREQFLAHAPTVETTIDGNAVRLVPREFKTGSFGWRADGKVPVTVDGQQVMATLGLNLIAIGSKDM